MELNFLGAEQNLNVLQGEAAEYLTRFVGDAGEAIDLSNITFDGVVLKPDGSTESIAITQDADDTSALHITLPALAEVNSYGYEIRATDDSGASMRIAYGKLGVLPTDLDLQSSAEEDTAERALLVHLPGKAKAHVMMVWRATTKAALCAEAARQSALSAMQYSEDAQGRADAAKRYADAAKDYADEAKRAKEGVKKEADAAIKEAADTIVQEAAESAKRAEDFAQQAQSAVGEVKGSAKELAEQATAELREELKELIDDTEQTRKSTDVTVQKLEGFLADFGDRVRSVVWVNPENDHLIIGGVDTGCKVTGEPGKSPYVNEAGEWMYWDDEADEWRNGGPARGEDGFSPYVNAEGYLVYRDPLTGEIRTGVDKMYGKDGLDATHVRRIVVPSVEDIPQEGETCNGGFYYYVALKDAPPVAIFTPGEERQTESSILVNRKEVPLPSPSLDSAQAAEALAESLRSVFPDAVVQLDPESNAVILIADVAYWQVRGLPEAEWNLTLHVRMPRDGYDVYAWLEEQDGSAAWVHVGEANDLATAEVYGLTKLGTDATIERGAPVGTDEAGRMHVPSADSTQRGAVQLSVDGQISDGVGGIGVAIDGKIWARRASRTTYGVVKPSFTGSAESAPVIGMSEEGQLQVPYATLGQAGVVLLGSRFGQGNPIPYKVGIGADDGHHLANNLVYGGALQHMQPSGWTSHAMPWLDELMAQHPDYFHDMYYQGLVTSLQFTQSMVNGLELLSATTSLKAGVYLAVDIPGENRDDAVPTATTVRNWVHAECYTKSQIDTKISSINSNISDQITSLNSNISDEVKTLNSKISNEVKKLNTRIDNDVNAINTSIKEKEEALSQRIDANKKQFDNYTDTAGLKQYVANQLKPYATTVAVNTALTSYYKKTEADNLLKRKIDACDDCTAFGVAQQGEDMRALSQAHPKTFYIQTQAKAKV